MAILEKTSGKRPVGWLGSRLARLEHARHLMTKAALPQRYRNAPTGRGPVSSLRLVHSSPWSTKRTVILPARPPSGRSRKRNAKSSGNRGLLG